MTLSRSDAEKAASTDKDIMVIDGATHVDLYDIPQYVDPAATRIGTFFNEKL